MGKKDLTALPWRNIGSIGTEIIENADPFDKETGTDSNHLMQNPDYKVDAYS